MSEKGEGSTLMSMNDLSRRKSVLRTQSQHEEGLDLDKWLVPGISTWQNFKISVVILVIYFQAFVGRVLSYFLESLIISACSTVLIISACTIIIVSRFDSILHQLPC